MTTVKASVFNGTSLDGFIARRVRWLVCVGQVITRRN
jgi:hypothetical protein